MLRQRNRWLGREELWTQELSISCFKNMLERENDVLCLVLSNCVISNPPSPASQVLANLLAIMYSCSRNFLTSVPWERNSLSSILAYCWNQDKPS